jgi:DNA-binding NtrC family response regulator
MPDRICLVVDDEPAIRGFLRIILEPQQLQILEAENAAQAMKVLQGFGERLDLIMSDIQMPGDMDGMDLAHSVRNTYPAIPVILISGYWDGEAAIREGFKVIPKPFGPETILNAVRTALNSRPT